MKSFTLLLLSTSILLAGSCNQKKALTGADGPAGSTAYQVEAYSPVFPVLIGKENNPVFRINVKVPETEMAPEVAEIRASLAGTTRLADIASVKAFYTSDEPDFSGEALFGEAAPKAEQLTVTGSQPLKPGDNYFWLSLTVNGTSDLLHNVAAEAIGVKIGAETLAIPTREQPLLKRLGHALRQHGDDGVDTYRIPGLATTNEGTLIAVYDIRYNSSVDLQEDVDVGMSRSTDGGQSWEPMKVIMDMEEWGGLP